MKSLGDGPHSFKIYTKELAYLAQLWDLVDFSFLSSLAELCILLFHIMVLAYYVLDGLGLLHILFVLEKNLHWL